MNTEEPISITIANYWATIVRRKLLIAAAIVLCVLVAGLLCLVLPKSYRSSTLILIENPKIPEDIVKGIVGGSVEERLTMIQQQVMSRTLLSQVIQEFKLNDGNTEEGEIEPIIENLRKKIKIELVGTRGKSIEAFTISFAHEEPVTAMKVTAKLASQYIEENLKVREQMVTGVSAFLEQELATAKAALEAQEQAIGKFKTKHIGLLPEQMEANLRALDRLQLDLNATEDMLHKETDRLSLVEKSIKEYEASGTTQNGLGTPGNSHTSADPLLARLRELQKHLTTLQAEYKETYPDIGSTKQEIEGVKRQLAEKYGDPSDEKDSDAAKTYDPYLRELMRQRNELRLEVASVKDRRKRLAEHMKAFENRVEQTPSREQELMILVRDYQNMQKNYQALLDKRLNAHVAENLEKRQKGEQFRVLDPANLPAKPEKPNQLLIMLAGLLGGCGLGFGLAIGLEHLNPTFKRREDIETLPGIRVLAAIPNFQKLYQQLKSKPVIANNEADARLPVSRGHSYPWIAGDNNGEFPQHLNLVAKWQPLSIAAEQYRMAATRLVLSNEGRESSVIEITSALKGEGKTTTVANLGYTLARDLGKRTLLIDCDFRCPALQNYVRNSPRPGLIEFLDGRAELKECLSRIDEVSCSVLLVGKAEGELNELTRIQELKGFLPQLRKQFEYIIINTPPVLPSATMGILASLADVLVFVIKAGSTPKHVVQQAFAMVGLAGEANVVLNAVEVQSMPAYIYGYPMAYGAERSIASSIK
jgi:polysaccharide biosynthesis transport protein